MCCRARRRAIALSACADANCAAGVPIVSTWVIVYDIADNRRRRQIAAMLERCATRLQLSVFKARLDPMEAASLRRSLMVHIVPAVDSIRFYPVASGQATMDRYTIV